ncbi:L-threonylcarbamoyladenylate synthase [Maribacter antarcticus]|uniref:L-threonylcarbamoyladenylate synthase n=1 Tax=Maribacter antarcticus TaxID=505250 RepID=UPI00047D3A14|nr:L-threonylcarbamoyladenylate synthase [Maribacter antarcticus]
MQNVITTDINYCQQLLKENKLVAIPTETVYGLAANAFNEKAVKQIFEMKGRPLFNPLILHIHDIAQLQQLAIAIPDKAMQLAKAFWPGALTLILAKNDFVPNSITGGKQTVGVRMPNHPVTIELLQGLDFPLAAPSANPFTRVSPTSAEHVAYYFGNRIPAILDGGPCKVGLESTIVGFDGEHPVVYRKGGISIEDIEAVVGKVTLVTENETTPQAPGMLLKHYSPNTQLVVSNTILDTIREHQHLKLGVLSFKNEFTHENVTVKTLSKQGDLEEAAKNLFAALYELDELNLDLIIAEKFPNTGLGASINDRLRRAVSN